MVLSGCSAPVLERGKPTSSAIGPSSISHIAT